jgi:excisionase family DNA binding protein
MRQPLLEEHQTEPLLTYRQLERELGVKKNTLFYWVSKGEIPHVRLGARTVRFRRSDLEAWLASRRVGAGERISEVPTPRGRSAA